jgi:hypothetical protein
MSRSYNHHPLRLHRCVVGLLYLLHLKLYIRFKIRAFWDIVACSLGGDRRFRGAYYLNHDPNLGKLVSETSVHSNETTRRCIPEGSNLRTRRRENLKSHIYAFIWPVSSTCSPAHHNTAPLW